MKGEGMTIGEWFEADRVFLEDINLEAEASEYAASAARFLNEKWNADVEDLTPKQVSWASRILDDMVERRIERRRR